MDNFLTKQWRVSYMCPNKACREIYTHLWNRHQLAILVPQLLDQGCLSLIIEDKVYAQEQDLEDLEEIVQSANNLQQVINPTGNFQR